MFLILGAGGECRDAGPALRRIAPQGTGCGAEFFRSFEVLRPGGIRDMAGLRRHGGQRLSVALLDPPGTALRGLAVPLDIREDPGAVLLNFSFGASVAEAVRSHQLTDADFAPTDLTVDMLYLIEAKAAVMGELQSMNRQLELAHRTALAEAMSDSLTGLANRRALETALEPLTLPGAPAFALAHLDLDHFKKVNDTSGHAAGDDVLVAVACILQEETRHQDVVARVGGDEFILLLRDLADPQRIEALCTRIIRRLEMPMRISGRETYISGSFGVVLSGDYPVGHRSRMLEDADRALYASKGCGRARVTLLRGGAKH